MKTPILLLAALLTCFNGNSQTAEEYINMADSKTQSKNYIGALEDVNKAIELEPTNEKYPTIKGLVKFSLGDTRGAIADYTQAIELMPDYAMAYYFRGNAKSEFEDYRGAIGDYTQAIELKQDYVYAYNNRGLSKLRLGRKNSGCLDLSKAGELGYSDAYSVIKENCN